MLIYIVIGVLATIMFTAYYISRERQKEKQERENERNYRIVNGVTSDPIHAIYLVRQYILDKYKTVDSYEKWKETADAIMMYWLKGPEGQKFKFTDITYRVYANDDTKTCIKCTIKDEHKVEIVIDLSKGIQKLVTDDGRLMWMCDTGNYRMLPYIRPNTSVKLGRIITDPRIRL